MGEVGQTQQGWNQPIGDQRLSILDWPNASHNGKHMSQKQISWMILPVVIIGPANVKLQEVA